MASALETLRAQARVLHRLARRGEPAALARVRDVRADSPQVLRRHCLTTRARELGFDGWPHAVAVLDGRPVRDYGTLLCPARCAAHWNIWCARYDEARRIRAERGDYLLAYRHQFLVVESHFVATLGLDPDDPDWQRIGHDWAQPRDHAARDRLYCALVRAHPPVPSPA